MSKKPSAPASSERAPVTIIYGDEEFRKHATLHQTLSNLIPADVDRDLALSEYDGSKFGAEGGPTVASVFDDLNTLPFLAERRVVVVRDADAFISASRESLERYAAAPSPTGSLVLMCRSFPKTTKLYKAIERQRCPIIECKKLKNHELIGVVLELARERGKRMDKLLAERLVDLIGQDEGCLTNEVEKLAQFAADRANITAEDIALLVGQSREERIFAVMDAAGQRQTSKAMTLWRQVLDNDPTAVFKVLGGLAFVLRRWLSAHQMIAAGESVFSIAPKVMMWNRQNELEQILRFQPPGRVKRHLARLAELDTQAKEGARSIEMGIDAVLLDICGSR